MSGAWAGSRPDLGPLLRAITHPQPTNQPTPPPPTPCSFLGLDPELGRTTLTRSNTREHHLVAKGELRPGQRVSCLLPAVTAAAVLHVCECDAVGALTFPAHVCSTCVCWRWHA